MGVKLKECVETRPRNNQTKIRVKTTTGDAGNSPMRDFLLMCIPLVILFAIYKISLNPWISDIGEPRQVQEDPQMKREKALEQALYQIALKEQRAQFAADAQFLNAIDENSCYDVLETTILPPKPKRKVKESILARSKARKKRPNVKKSGGFKKKMRFAHNKPSNSPASPPVMSYLSNAFWGIEDTIPVQKGTEPQIAGKGASGEKKKKKPKKKKFGSRG